MEERYFKAREDREYGVVFDYYDRLTEDQLIGKFSSNAYRKIETPSDAQRSTELKRILKEYGIRREQDIPAYIGKVSPLKINKDGHLVNRSSTEVNAAKQALREREEANIKHREAYTLREQYKDIDNQTAREITTSTFKYKNNRFSMSMSAQLNWNTIMNAYRNDPGRFTDITISKQPTDGGYMETPYTLYRDDIVPFFTEFQKALKGILMKGNQRKYSMNQEETI